MSVRIRAEHNDAWELVLSALGVGLLATWIITTWGAPWPGVVSVFTAMTAALLLRRRMLPLVLPLTPLVIVAPALMGVNAVGPWAVAQILLFSFTLHATASRSVWVAVGIATVMTTMCIVAYPAGSPGLPLGVVAWTFGIWGLATSIAAQRALVRALAERADELERNREREIQQHLTAQRMQIARDLHDELAHNVAVISVNAGAAEAALPPGADASRAALWTVRNTARGVLSELQDILGLLREETARDSVLPQLSDIVRAAGELGLRTIVEGSWIPTSEPQTSQLAAARVLQESLTNARRHGSSGTAEVALTTTATRWSMTITNPVDLTPLTDAMRVGGFGLIGMAERAELIGGTFTSRRTDNSWTATLTLPLRSIELTEVG